MATALIWFDRTLGWWGWQITSSDPPVLIVPVGRGGVDENTARQSVEHTLGCFNLQLDSPIGVIDNVGCKQ